MEELLGLPPRPAYILRNSWDAPCAQADPLGSSLSMFSNAAQGAPYPELLEWREPAKPIGS
jgi:hypothetical protein